MKLKHILLVLLCMILAASLAVAGTIAYLTDRDSAANIFTVGNVEIKLTENFVQGSTLVPGVDINKDVKITNTGKNDAWVWYTYAVPTALVDTGNNASLNAIHFNLEGAYWDSYYTNDKYYTAAGLSEPVKYEQTWHWEKIDHNIDINGVPYSVVTVLHNGPLAAGQTTYESLTNVYLDSRIDIDPDGNFNWVENGVVNKINWNIKTNGAPVVYVNAYAVQKEGFTTVNEAYDAYVDQWGTVNDALNGDFTTIVP